MAAPPAKALVAGALLPRPLLSIVIPVFNEAQNLSVLGVLVAQLRQRGHQVIVVDGGSSDGTWQALQTFECMVLRSGPGRARQMNTGAAQAEGEVIWFLHVDSELSESVLMALETQCQRGSDIFWGRFDVRLSGTHKAFRVIEWFMNQRSRLTGIATGDQGIFVHKTLWQRANGYAGLALMEDIDLSKRLRKMVSPVCLPQRLITSSRRWEKGGILRTVLLMWSLRALFFFGVSPQRLATWYR